jgi:Tfp pilus assembly protein PilO
MSIKINIKNRQQLLTIAAIAVAVLFVGDRLALRPLSKSWKDRADRIADLRKQVGQGELLVQRDQTIRRRWTNMRANTLTNDTSVAEQHLLKALDAWSQESRISVNSVTPQWKRDGDDYMTLECRVDASGSLATLTRFLYNVEKDPMALKLEAVEISSRDNNGQQISLGLQISGLMLNPPAE